MPVGYTEMGARIATLSTALTTRDNGGKAATVAVDLARHDVEDGLHQDGEYLNGKFDGTEGGALELSWPAYALSRSPRPNPPPAPTNLVLRHGTASGVARARFKAPWEGSFNEIQTCQGDPNVEANWHSALFFKGGKVDMPGLTPGAVYWFRVRTAGLGGVMGAWSDPAQLRAL